MKKSRKRHAITALIKKLKFARVVSLQGARQTGKSFLARHLISKFLPKAQRDILQFSSHRPDAQITEDILNLLAELDSPDASQIAKKLRIDARKISKHLKLLNQLFAIHSLSPHPLGSGKPLHFFCDPGLASLKGASFRTTLWTTLLFEQLSRHLRKNYWRVVQSLELP